jgi:MFS family permease
VVRETTKTIKPFYPWLVWLIAALFVSYQFILQTSTSVMVTRLEHDLHVSALGVSLISSSFFYTYILFQIPAGILTDCLGPRRVLGGSILLCVLSAVWFAMSQSPASAECARLLMGFSVSTGVVVALYLAATWFDIKRFALLVGLTEMTGMLGGALGEMILSHVVSSGFGWRGAVSIIAVAGFFLAIAAWIFVYDSPAHYCQEQKNIQTTASSITFKQLMMVLSIPQVWLVGLYSSLLFAILSAFASLWSVQFFMHVQGLSFNWAAFDSGLIFVGAALGSPFMGYWSDRLRRRCIPMQISSLMCLLTLGLMVYVPHLSSFLLMLLSLLLGVSASGYVVPFAFVGDMINPCLRATAMGLTNMLCILLGAPLFQPLIGWLLELTHTNFHIALSVLMAALLLAFFLTFFMRETFCQSCYQGER